MRVIALSLALASLCVAQIPSEYSEIIAGMASAISEDRPELAMTDVSKKMPDHDRLRDNLIALCEQAEVTSSVADLQEDNGEVTADWILRIKLKAEEGRMEERHETVAMRFGREGKKWKIVALQPVDFFGPPKMKM